MCRRALQDSAALLDDAPRAEVVVVAREEHPVEPASTRAWQGEPKHCGRNPAPSIFRYDDVADVAPRLTKDVVQAMAEHQAADELGADEAPVHRARDVVLGQMKTPLVVIQ